MNFRQLKNHKITIQSLFFFFLNEEWAGMQPKMEDLSNENIKKGAHKKSMVGKEREKG